MAFKVGDKVIHWNYGLGEIIQLDDKLLTDKMTQCYVVRIRDLTIWVPVNDMGKCSLRLPTPKSEFENLFAILSSPGEPLSSDRLERKTYLFEIMKDGKLDGICRVVRDLSNYRRAKKLNDHDKSMLEHARNFLLNEWKLSLSVPMAQAEQELKSLLGEPTKTVVN